MPVDFQELLVIETTFTYLLQVPTFSYISHVKSLSNEVLRTSGPPNATATSEMVVRTVIVKKQI